jgi:KEOPS complex subunit Cgi121
VEPLVGSGHLKTDNIEEIKSLINPNFALINPKVVCGHLHLKQAAYLADKAHAGKYNLSNDKSTEVLLYLTAQRQISKAIEIGGIKEGQKSIAWVSFGSVPDSLSSILDSDDSVVSCANFDYFKAHLDKKVISKMNSEDKQKIVMTRTATLPVQPR